MIKYNQGDTNMSILSENLKLLHQESGLTYEELSIRTGINESILKAFENEKLEPNEYQLEVLCRVLRFPYEDIYERNLIEERKTATKRMRSSNTRTQYNWYFGDRKVFWFYLSYIIFFVVMVTCLSLYYINKLSEINFLELYSLYKAQFGITISYPLFCFEIVYNEIFIGLSVFGFGVAGFIGFDYFKKHQFVFRWWMIFFISTIIAFLRIFGIIAAIPYLVICICNLIKGKY